MGIRSFFAKKSTLIIIGILILIFVALYYLNSFGMLFTASTTISAPDQNNADIRIYEDTRVADSIKAAMAKDSVKLDL